MGGTAASACLYPDKDIAKFMTSQAVNLSEMKGLKLTCPVKPARRGNLIPEGFCTLDPFFSVRSLIV